MVGCDGGRLTGRWNGGCSQTPTSPAWDGRETIRLLERIDEFLMALDAEEARRSSREGSRDLLDRPRTLDGVASESTPSR
jgi:hypothetical protein